MKLNPMDPLAVRVLEYMEGNRDRPGEPCFACGGPIRKSNFWSVSVIAAILKMEREAVRIAFVDLETRNKIYSAGGALIGLDDGSIYPQESERLFGLSEDRPTMHNALFLPERAGEGEYTAARR